MADKITVFDHWTGGASCHHHIIVQQIPSDIPGIPPTVEVTQMEPAHGMVLTARQASELGRALIKAAKKVLP